MTEKLRYLQQKKFNAADELRDRLTQLEEQLVNIKQLTQAEALSILTDLDRVSQLIEQLTTAGANLAPEEGRFDSIQRRLRKQTGPWLKAIGGRKELQQHSPTPPPAPDHWWWQIDHIVAVRRHQQRKRIVLALAVLLFLVTGVAVALKTVFAPDPAVLARLEAENEANAAMGVGDYQTALDALETGLTATPNDPRLLLFKTVVLEIAGQEAASAQVAEQAQAAFADPLALHLNWSQLELQFNRPQQAEEHARLALTLDEESALGWFSLGQALEVQQDRPAAIDAYETAADLAQAADDSELLVMVRMTMARLLMNPGG